MNMIKLRKIWAVVLLAFLISAIGLTVYFLVAGAKTDGGFDIIAVAENFGTITMDAVYDDTAHELSVMQKTEYFNKTDRKLDRVIFHIYANAYAENAAYPPVAKNETTNAYPNGLSFGGITIKKVTGGTMKLTGDDNTVLSVGFIVPLSPNARREITIEYTVKLANIKHRLGWTDDFVNLGNFYPVPAVYDKGWKTHSYSSNGDPFYNDMYNFDITLNVPTDFVVAHSGERISANRYRAYAIRDFAFVLSKGFQKLSAELNNTTVNYYFTADDTPEIALQTAVKAFDYFSREFGPYPYPALTVVQTAFLHGGMEYGSLVYVSNSIDPKNIAYSTVIVHEIAHQWWYGLVGNDQTQTAWIDEGLTEYSTAVFFESHPEYGERIDEIADNNLTTLSFYDEVLTKLGTVFDKRMNRDINDFRTGYEYTFCTYCRGMILFYNIAKMSGYGTFNSALRAFADANKFGFGTKEALISALETALNTELTAYFDNYLAG
jgi:hypothetical protein